MALRTFLALPLDEEALDALGGLQRRLDACGADVRWTPRKNLHVTLKFLGDVPDDDFDEVCRVAARAAGELGGFEYALGGVALAPAAGAPRMVWTRVLDADGRLAALAERLNADMATLGFSLERRRFQGHVTLGRIKTLRCAAALRQAVEDAPPPKLPPRWADALVVYTSVLRRGGADYTAACTLELP